MSFEGCPKEGLDGLLKEAKNDKIPKRLFKGESFGPMSNLGSSIKQLSDVS